MQDAEVTVIVDSNVDVGASSRRGGWKQATTLRYGRSDGCCFPPSVDRAISAGDRTRLVRSRPFVASSFIIGSSRSAAARAVERHALWQVVRACVADYQATGAPFPAWRWISPADSTAATVVLRPPFGAPDTILAPTRKVVGVEDPWLQSPAAPNYFAAAMRARAFVKRPDGSAPRLDEIALAVNSRFTRTQDQLHIHIGCAPPRIRRTLRPRRLDEGRRVGAHRLARPRIASSGDAHGAVGSRPDRAVSLGRGTICSGTPTSVD